MLRQTKQDIEAMIRVNHAGEYGAKRIYAGQLAVLKNSASAETIKHMAEQEEGHLQKFNEIVNQRRVRPTVLMPAWHMFGYLLGAGTALLGEKAAMACTVAVEDVIDKHYEEQLEKLDSDEAELKQTIEKFRAEEIEHKNIGLENGAEQAPAYEVLSGAVKAATKLAIWLSYRV